MSSELKAAGYMIQDKQGIVIYGIGESVDEAWAEVVDGVGTFFDNFGNDIPADDTFEAQFEIYAATRALMDRARMEGGSICWGVIGGVACTVEEAEDALS